MAAKLVTVVEKAVAFVDNHVGLDVGPSGAPSARVAVAPPAGGGFSSLERLPSLVINRVTAFSRLSRGSVPARRAFPGKSPAR